MDDIRLVAPSKRKRKHKQINEDEEIVDHQLNETDLDTSLSVVCDSDENRKRKKKHKKDREEHSDEHENQLAFNDTAESEVDIIQHKKRKKKKHKKDREAHCDGIENQLTVNDTESEVDTINHKKKKKKKKHSKETERLSYVYGTIQENKHSGRPAEHSSPSKTQNEDGFPNSSSLSESQNQTDNSTDDQIHTSDNVDNLVDQQNTTEKSSSKNSKRKKKCWEDYIAALTLTEEETAIVHSGKYSSLQKDVEEFRKRGISLRTGKWIAQEDEILIENFENIKNDTVVDIDNAFLMQILFLNLIGCEQNEHRKVRSFLRESNFHVRLAGNLRRSPESVMDRARKILPAWKTGPFSKKEEEKLLDLIKKFGNKWTLIGFHLNRSRNSVLDHYRIIKDDARRKGKWTEDETNDLIQIISEVMQVDDLLSVPHFNMPWNQIGKKMSSRDGKQCRSHWVYYIRPMLEQGSSKKVSLNREEVIAEICKLDIETENEIDWVELMEKIPEAGTPQQLMVVWQKVKSSIDGGDRMTFDQIREALCGESE